MAINAMIPMGVQVADPLNALAKGYELGNTIRQQPMMDQMNQQKLDAGKIEIQNAKLKQQQTALGMPESEFKSAYYGAAQIAPLLAAGDMNSVMSTIEQRKQAKQVIGMPTDLEDDFLAELQSNPEQAKKSIAHTLAIGQQMFGKAQTGKYSAPIPAVGPDGKLVYIQGAPTGGAPNVLQGYSPPPSAADQAAALQAQQSAAMAALLAGGVGGSSPQGSIPSPNVTTGNSNPFANMTPAQIALLPPDVQKKAFEQSINPKTIDQQKQAAKRDEVRRTAAGLIGGLLEDKGAVRSVVGGYDAMTPTFFGSSLEAENKIKRLRSMLTSENLDLMTGILTDTDMQVLREISAGELDQRRDQDAFIRDLETLFNKLAGDRGQVQRSGAPSPQSGGTIEVDF